MQAANGLDNCEFIAGDVLKVVGTLKDKPDLIVLDRQEMVFIQKHWIRSLILAWIIWFTFPVSRPVW